MDLLKEKCVADLSKLVHDYRQNASADEFLLNLMMHTDKDEKVKEKWRGH